ncbi:MAG TPA: ABC transporter substrate-binding protein, partial [Chloroflexota bacterium]|nr:ABC transporter substrate-binding protein [Chloroflexota bacterium]
MRVTIQVSAIAAAGALLLAACGSAAAPSSAPAAAPASSAAAKPASAPAASGSAAVKPSAAASGASSAAAKPAAAGSAPAVALPKPEVTSIKIGNASHEAHSYPPQYALDQGIYKKYGFTNVTTTYFDGDAKARQAILAGQIDIMSGSPGTSIVTANTDTPVLTIGMYVDHPTDDLASIPSVKNVGDLKGKKVAVSSYGGDSHASVVLSLKALGLTSKDVTIVEIGGESARIAALASGTVAAAPIDETDEDKVKSQGMNILIRLPDAPVTLARTGLLVRKDYAAKNPNTVLDVLGSTMEALQLEI